MLAVEMILSQAPRLILLDEPSAGLAPSLVREVLAQISEVVVEDSCAVLLVEQRVDEAMRVAHRWLKLQEGRIEAGDPAPDHPRASADTGGA